MSSHPSFLWLCFHRIQQQTTWSCLDHMLLGNCASRRVVTARGNVEKPRFYPFRVRIREVEVLRDGACPFNYEPSIKQSCHSFAKQRLLPTQHSDNPASLSPTRSVHTCRDRVSSRRRELLAVTGRMESACEQYPNNSAKGKFVEERCWIIKVDWVEEESMVTQGPPQQQR